MAQSFSISNPVGMTFDKLDPARRLAGTFCLAPYIPPPPPPPPHPLSSFTQYRAGRRCGPVVSVNCSHLI